MKSNRNFRFVGLLALALLVMSFAPLAASAQSYEGTFKLPFQARWNGLVMPAGEYTIRINDVSPSGMVVVKHDGKNVGILFVGSIAATAFTGKSELVAVGDGEEYTITVLRLHGEGVLNYPAPGNKRMRARGQEISLRVPIENNSQAHGG